MMFLSNYNEAIKNFITEKRICGYKYITDENGLKRFDSFLYLNNINIINKSVIDLWVELHPNWSINSKARSINTIREFLRYLNRYHLNNYTIPNIIYKHITNSYVPYIFSVEEIKLIFKYADLYTSKKYLEMKYIVPFIFRLLYGTGIRIGECLNIKRNNIDIDSGTIKLTDTKNKTERLIVLSDSLLIYLKQFLNKMNKSSEYLFYNNKENKLSISNIETIFKKLLMQAHINNGENLPRIHDLRFTFIVHSFRKYCSTGKDPMAFLPILQNYVGHKSIKSLEYYLKTTNIDLENALKISEREFGSLIPTIGNKYE